jgi:hypothetical protein
MYLIANILEGLLIKDDQNPRIFRYESVVPLSLVLSTNFLRALYPQPQYLP